MTLDRDLARLREAAPDHLLPEILASTGLADRYVVTDTVIGRVFVAFNERGVSAVDVARSARDFEEGFADRFGRPAIPTEAVPAPIAAHLERAISEGRPGRLDLDLSSVTPFQVSVLEKTAEIPAGEIRPYGWIAGEIGKPGATRAVGTALARNPVPLIVPCHRVVRSDGRLGNYSLGARGNKRRLLEAEGIDTALVEAAAARGVRFVGSDTTSIFCHPTCRDARRITDKHRVEFRTAAAATQAGYRPCKRCRPAVAA